MLCVVSGSISIGGMGLYAAGMGSEQCSPRRSANTWDRIGGYAVGKGA